MLCEKCHENEVSYIISISSGNLIRELQICEECASYNTDHKVLGSAEDVAKVDRECPNCHSRYLKSSKLGCPVCYEEFQEELKLVINRIHGSTIYIEEETDKSGQSIDIKNKAGKLRYINHAPFFDPGWMKQTGPDSDVIISTRIRLARNISGYRFCRALDYSKLSEIAGVVEKAISEISGNSQLHLYNSYVIDIGRLNNIDRKLLVERYLISKELAEKADEKNQRDESIVYKNSPFKVIISEDEIVSIMINEEDHIRLQIINSGLQLEDSWKIIKAIDDSLSQKLQYAFSSQWGYLTACPTNVGTGLRASVMFHIPALATTKEGNKILSSIANMGYAVRGIYGEGSEAIGGFFQISYEFTLGQSSREVIDRIYMIALQIVNLERAEQKKLIEKERIKTEDTIFRSYGILMNARLISSIEALEHLSWVSLGFNLGILQNPRSKEDSRAKIAQLLVLIRSAHLQKYAGKQLDILERDSNRASLIKAILVL